MEKHIFLKPTNEKHRLIALARSRLANDEPNPYLDHIAMIASELFDVPFALITFIDEELQWLKSAVGVERGCSPRKDAFCNYTILTDDIFVVLDATKDDRFKDNPFVTGDMHVRFYAGVPIILNKQYLIGALCLLDQKPRESFGEDERELLSKLRHTIVHYIESGNIHETAENKNKDGLQIFQKFCEGIQSAIIIFNNRRKIVFNNNNFDYLFQVKNIIGENIEKITDKFNFEHGVENIEDIKHLISIESENKITIDGSYKIEGKRDIYLSCTAQKLDEFFGNQEYYALSFLDRSLEVTASHEAQTLQHQFAALFDKIRDHVVILDTEARILNANQNFLSLTKSSLTDVIGRYLWTVPPFTQPMNPEIKQSALLPQFIHERGGSYELVLRGSNGAEIALVCGVKYIDQDDGLEPIVIWTGNDVTQFRQAQTALATAHRMESLGQLTGGMAHDFNNLLGIMLGNVELIMTSDELGNKNKKRLKATIDAIHRGAELTNSLLAFSRRRMLENVPLSVNETLKEFSIIIERTLGEQIELETKFLDQDRLIHTDKAQFESALLNLVINARDAMPQGGNLLIDCTLDTIDETKIEHHDQLPAGDYVIISVSDNGGGIAPDIVKHVLEPFYSTKPEGKGSGLGLSMAFGFMRQSQGNLLIESTLGQGTTVSLFFPVYIGSEDPTPVRKENTSLEIVTGNSEIVLLVEDQDPVREMAEDMLQELGYKVLAAHNGPQALELIKSTCKIDVIFTDIVMPCGISGKDVADFAAKERGNIPVVFATGYSENSVLDEIKKRNMPILSKPYCKADVSQALARVLK